LEPRGEFHLNMWTGKQEFVPYKRR
jgi:hypothetical protein